MNIWVHLLKNHRSDLFRGINKSIFITKTGGYGRKRLSRTPQGRPSLSPSGAAQQEGTAPFPCSGQEGHKGMWRPQTSTTGGGKPEETSVEPILVALSMSRRSLGLKGHPGRQNNLMNGALCEPANSPIPLGLETTREEGLSHLPSALCGV